MRTLWFIVPVHGRIPLATICLEQLRRTCDSLTEHGIAATALLVGDLADLTQLPDLGFGRVVRDNRFTSQKYNDGIQVACDPDLKPKLCGVYRVLGKRDFRGHAPDEVFAAQLEPRQERRAVDRGSIQKVGDINEFATTFTLPRGFDVPADYVVPFGSDDWADWRIFTDLPDAGSVFGFQKLSFVRPDGLEMVQRWVNVRGGCGIRIYPREIMGYLDYRPADEDRKRACDTSIITNLHKRRPFKVFHIDTDPRQIVDWKSSDNQLNPYESLTFHKTFENPQDPFVALADLYPAESLSAMKAHYARVREHELVVA